MLTTVLFPIPFLPSSPTTSPFLGVGNLYNRKEFTPYWWILSVANSLAKFTIVIASNGHTLTHIPHPLQISSSIWAFFDSSLIVTHSAPDLFTGQYFMHSNPHFCGWHRSWSNTATLCVIVVIRYFLCFIPILSWFEIFRYLNR